MKATNIKISNKLKNFYEVFTKDYRRREAQKEAIKKHYDIFRLEPDSFDVDESINRLKLVNYNKQK